MLVFTKRHPLSFVEVVVIQSGAIPPAIPARDAHGNHWWCRHCSSETLDNEGGCTTCDQQIRRYGWWQADAACAADERLADQAGRQLRAGGWYVRDGLDPVRRCVAGPYAAMEQALAAAINFGPAYRVEFPELRDAGLPAIPDTFDDVSLAEEGAPRWCSEELHLTLRVYQQARADAFTFQLIRGTGRTSDALILETEVWAEILAHLRARK